MLNHFFSNYLFFLSKIRKRKRFSLQHTSLGVFTVVLFLCTTSFYGQTVTGVVRGGDTSEPLPGVPINLKGTTMGTSTDFDGKFSISLSGTNPILVFSYMGYKPKEVVVNGQKVINVTLEIDSNQLDEVVIVDYGYGKVKRSDMTGAVSSISGKDLERIPVATVSEAITGKLPGVNVTSADGEPGADVQIRVRGGGSITQDNAPLYVVDGFIVNTINDIPSSDIESVDVLKDAAATAVYGARASNGVIVITTKSPKKGKVSIAYNNYFQFNSLPADRSYEVLSPYEFVLANYEYQALRGETAVKDHVRYFGNFSDIDIYKSKKPTDWQDELFGGSRLSQFHNLSISGGTEMTSMRLSVSRNDEEGLLVGSEYGRTAINFKLDQKITDKLKFEGGARITNTVIDGAGTSTNAQLKIKDAVQTRPVNGIADDLDIDLNQPNSDDDYQQFLLSLVDPRDLVEQDWRKRTYNSYVLNAGLNWEIINGLVFKTIFTTEQEFREELRFYGPLTGESFNNGGSLPIGQKDNIENFSRRWLNTLNYKKSWGDNYKMDFLLGQEISSNGGKRDFTRSEDFRASITPQELFANMAFGRVDRKETEDYTDSNRRSVFGRFDFQLYNKYIFTLSFRADESSRFSENNRRGYFPALAFAWKIHEEGFMKNVDFVNELKLRLSYGQTGNDRVPATATQFLFGATTNRGPGFGNIDNVYYAPDSNSLYNPDLKWETTSTNNLGLDFLLFNKRINGTLDVYSNTTTNLLLQSAIPNNTGFTTQWNNIGATSNKGIEFGVTGYIVDNKDFTLSANFNIGKNDFRIDALDGTNERFERSNWASTDLNNINDYYLRVGGKVGDIYGYVTDGMYTVDDFTQYNATTKTYELKPGIPNAGGTVGNTNIRPGFLKLKDLPTIDTDGDGIADTGDGVINADDRQVIGNALPDFQGGFGLTARYKAFDFSIFFNYQSGNDVYNTGKIQFNQLRRVTNGNMLDNMNSGNRFTYIDVDGQYTGTPGGVVTDLAQLAEMNPNKNMWSHASFGGAGALIHSWAVEDGSFIRLNNLTLGYSLPTNLISKIGVSQFRVFATGRNLHLWTKYSGYDPEVNSRGNGLTPGVDDSSYPRSRSYTVGLNVTF
ncbi:SusC/RagA family TonB-linked outer membrane protein [Flavobacterium agrisoli]|uniref:TonB-dependent receptor n=1 Tax=Flavobacterium agrisoli TaxID=2793066 RepID=A0A934PMV0_9FLAO|nr:TonB-dependent receptor [Flavobacterium agrisoli]MBK0370194.1 TonB-dependent receptor [Flavobacterium agrisoli]